MIRVYRTLTQSEHSISRLILISPRNDDDESIADFATKVAFGNTIEGDLVEFSDKLCFYFVAGRWWRFECFDDFMFDDDDDDFDDDFDDDNNLALDE